jgi:esterase/lipase
MKHLLSVLDWFNLLDNEKKLSITNCAVVALIIKMLVSPNLDWPSITGMIVVFANYMHKRQSTDASVASDQTEEMKKIKAQYEAAVIAQAKTITEVRDQVSRVTQAVDFSKLVKR